MSDHLVFVLHTPTGHAYPIAASTIDPDVHEVIKGEPATLTGGTPRPPIYHYVEPRQPDADTKDAEAADTKATPKTDTKTTPKEK